VDLRYDGGARRVRPDGSIEIDGRLRISVVPAVVAFLVSWGVMLRWPDLTPLLIGLWALALVKLSRRAHRLLVFDAGSRVLRVVDRGWRKRERVIAFADIHALAVEQREPRGESRRVRASPSDRDERGVAPRGAPLLRNVRIRVHFRRYSA
jgi:hypothetical protein